MTTQSVQVKVELGHRASLRKKTTSEGFTHDWTVFVRGPEGSNIQHFVDKVVFHLHESFMKPKRVIKEPPYHVAESGYAGFLLPIEIYFKNKEDPKRIVFEYDLFLNADGFPPINHIRCEKLTFQNPTEDFRRKLIKAGGIGIPGPNDHSHYPGGSAPQGGNATEAPSSVPTPLPAPPELDTFTSLFGTPIKTETPKKIKPAPPVKEKPTAVVNPTVSSKPKQPESPPVDVKTKTPKKKKDQDKSKEERRHGEKVSPHSKQSHKSHKDHHRSSSKHRHLSREKSQESTGTLKKTSSQSQQSPSSRPQVSTTQQSSNKPSGESRSDMPVLNSEQDIGEISDIEVDLSTSDIDDILGGSGAKTGKQSNNEFGSLWAEINELAPDEEEVLSPLPKNSPSTFFSSSRHLSPGITSSPKPNSDNTSQTAIRHSSPKPHKSKSKHKKHNKKEGHHSKHSSSSSSSKPSKDEAKENNCYSANAKYRSQDNLDVITNPDTTFIKSKDPSSPSKHSKQDRDNLKSKVSSSPRRGVNGLPGSPKKKDKVAQNGEKLSVLLELQRRLMIAEDKRLLQQVVDLIEETGQYKINDKTFDFDLCSLDMKTVHKLQRFLEH